MIRILWAALLALSSVPHTTTSAIAQSAAQRCEREVGDAAIAACTSAIRENARNSAAWERRAFALTNKGELERALGDIEEAIRLNPNYARAYNTRGNIWLRRDDLDAALRDYNTAIRLDPKYANPLSNRGNLKLQRGDYDGALLDLNEAVRINPRLWQAYEARARVWSKIYLPSRALEDLDTAIRINPHDSNLYYRRGMLRVEFLWDGFYADDIESAIHDFNEAIRLSPNSASLYYARGNAKYEARYDLGSIISDYDLSLRLDPNFLSALSKRCEVWISHYRQTYQQLLLERTDYNELYKISNFDFLGNLFSACEVAAQSDPSFKETEEYLEVAYILLTRGLIWQFEGDDERAILDFNEAIRIRPNHSTYESRGSFWLDKRELDRAISDLTIALDFLNSSCSRCPEIVSTYTFRAEAFSLRGEFEQALADYSAAIDIAPGAAFIFRDRGGIRAQQRNFGDAVLDFNRAIELGLNSWHTYYLRALAREQILDLDVAMLDMRTAQRLGTTSIPAQYQTEIMEFFIRVTRTQARQESLRNSPPLNQNPPQSFLQHPEGSHVEHTSDLNSRSDEYFNAASRALERALVDLRQGLERIDRIQR